MSTPLHNAAGMCIAGFCMNSDEVLIKHTNTCCSSYIYDVDRAEKRDGDRDVTFLLRF